MQSRKKVHEKTEMFRGPIERMCGCATVYGAQNRGEDIVFADFNEATGDLKRDDEKYHALLDNASDGILIADSEGNFLKANKKAEQLLGYTKEELLGMNPAQIHPKEELEKVMRAFRGMSEGKLYSLSDTKILRKDGKTVPVDITGSAIDYAGKKVIQGIFRDITGRKEIEDALRESERRIRFLVETTSDWIWEVDQNNSYTYASLKVKDLLGYEPEEIVGRTPFYFMPDGEAERIAGLFKDIAESRKPFSGLVNMNLHKDGRPIVLEMSGTPLFDAQGKFLGYMGFDRDITQRKHAEDELMQTVEKLRKTLVGAIHAMSLTVEARDPYTSGHQKRVSTLARLIAQEMGYSSDAIDSIRMAGAIHDIGKMSIPAEILSKPTKLTDIEMSMIRVHPQSGYDILKDAELPYPIAEIVLQHHERINGSGYPQGLRGDQILPEARIVAVADVVEAIASHRPYRPAHDINTAIEEIEKNKGILYDREVVNMCVKLFREGRLKLE